MNAVNTVYSCFSRTNFFFVLIILELKKIDIELKIQDGLYKLVKAKKMKHSKKCRSSIPGPGKSIFWKKLFDNFI